MTKSVHDLVESFVREWMADNGIDMHQVITYHLNKVYGEPGTITLTMYMQPKEVADNG